jgi:hypothetical protein
MVAEDISLDYTLRCSFRPPLFVCFPEDYYVFHAPQPIG